jgi:Zn finger protein HypA/HybF involved in hydrogenase expression
MDIYQAARHAVRILTTAEAARVQTAEREAAETACPECERLREALRWYVQHCTSCGGYRAHHEADDPCLCDVARAALKEGKR